MQNLAKRGQQALRRGRYSEAGRIYFITFATLERTRWFHKPELAEIMCRQLNSNTITLDAKVLCFVVMPDHVHLLAQLGTRPLPSVVGRLKGSSAGTLNRQIGRQGQFWQESYYDHALRQEEDMLVIARYIVSNPVRSRLVKRVGDYPYWNAIWL